MRKVDAEIHGRVLVNSELVVEKNAQCESILENLQGERDSFGLKGYTSRSILIHRLHCLFYYGVATSLLACRMRSNGSLLQDHVAS